MGLLKWFISILPLRKGNDEDGEIQALRKEIENLQKENRDLKEKIIVLPKNNNEEIHIKLYDEGIEAEIIKNLRKSKFEICIAAAWLTSRILINELDNLKSRGVNIKVIISDQDSNNQGKLLEVSNSLRVVKLPQLGKYKNCMHHKYCIIDNKKVIDGSYNWSNNAQYNLEHILVIESVTVAKMFKNNFDKIYSNPSYYDFLVYDLLA